MAEDTDGYNIDVDDADFDTTTASYTHASTHCTYFLVLVSQFADCLVLGGDHCIQFIQHFSRLNGFY